LTVKIICLPPTLIFDKIDIEHNLLIQILNTIFSKSMSELQLEQSTGQKKNKVFSFFVWGISSLIALLFIAILYPSMCANRKQANEASAIASLRTLSSFQATLFEKEKFYCGSLTELFKANLIDERLAKGEKSGYIFEVIKSENNCELTAKPVSSYYGTRSFYFSDKGDWEFRVSTDENKVADANSPKLR
jgi:hypothetical protein